MKIAYDPDVDALYIRLVEGPVECEILQLNDRVSVNVGPGERIVGIEVLGASQIVDLRDRRVTLENLRQKTA